MQGSASPALHDAHSLEVPGSTPGTPIIRIHIKSFLVAPVKRNGWRIPPPVAEETLHGFAGSNPASGSTNTDVFLIVPPQVAELADAPACGAGGPPSVHQGSSPCLGPNQAGGAVRAMRTAPSEFLNHLPKHLLSGIFFLQVNHQGK